MYPYMANNFFKVYHEGTLSDLCFDPLFRPMFRPYVSTLCFETGDMQHEPMAASFLGILLQKTCWLQLVLDGFLIQRSQKAGCDKLQMRVDGDKGSEG